MSIRSTIGMIDLHTEPTADVNVRLVLKDGRVGYVPEIYQIHVQQQRTPASVVYLHWLREVLKSSSVVDRYGNPAEPLKEMGRKEIIAERADQVLRHMGMEPVAIVREPATICPTANLAGTEFIKDYTGCGIGTAYVDADNQLRAFHYGQSMPEGWAVPTGLKAVGVEMSATQVCFF